MAGIHGILQWWLKAAVYPFNQPGMAITAAGRDDKYLSCLNDMARVVHKE